MTEPLVIPFTTPGSEAAAAQTAALAAAIANLAAGVEGLTPKVAQAKTEEDRLAEAAGRAAQAQQTAATQAIALGQRMQGAAQAVQALATQFGGGPNRAVGLVSSMLTTSTHFAQLGLALGPGGAFVGGIVGAAIPALSALREEMETATASFDDARHSIAELTAAYANQREAAELQQRLATGAATLEEATDAATQAQARYNDEATRHHTQLAVALRDAEAELASRSAILGQLDIGYHTASVAAAQAVEDARSQLQANVALTESLRGVAEQTTATAEAQSVASRTASFMMDLGGAAGSRRSGGGGGESREDARARVAERNRQAQMDLDQEVADQEHANYLRSLAEEGQQDAMREAFHQREIARIEEAKAANLSAAEASQALNQMLAEQSMAQEEATIEAMASHNRQITAEASSVAASLISSLTDVITQIALGNATAEEGAQMMLAAFLSAISQRAQIEALAQVAQAISSYPDVAGIAAHVAGALAWGAVAVATGVGSAAISSGVSAAQSARQEAQRPASPQAGQSTEGKGGGTTVINFNSPVVTAQTTGALALGLRQMIGVSQTRYPAGV